MTVNLLSTPPATIVQIPPRVIKKTPKEIFDNDMNIVLKLMGNMSLTSQPTNRVLKF